MKTHDTDFADARNELDEVVDQTEQDMLMGLAGLVLGAFLTLLAVGIVSIIVLSLEPVLP